MSDEWGPWIEHDGAGLRGLVPQGAVVEVSFQKPGLTVGDKADGVPFDHPCFFWRWQQVRTGWFSSEWRRVCDDPAYAPAIRYRIRKPRGLVILEKLLADLPERIDA